MITACLGLIKFTSAHYDDGSVAIDSEKEFYRLQGDLYSLCRVKASCCILLCYTYVMPLSIVWCIFILNSAFMLSSL